jgi:hypothetical protein
VTFSKDNAAGFGRDGAGTPAGATKSEDKGVLRRLMPHSRSGS